MLLNWKIVCNQLVMTELKVRNAFKTLLKKKNEFAWTDISGEWMHIIKDPPWELKVHKLKYLNVISFCINPNRLKEFSCCKIVLQDNTTLYKSCVYRSTNSTIDSNDLLNQRIADVSNLKDDLFLLRDFNYPNINGRNYMLLILLKVVI